MQTLFIPVVTSVVTVAVTLIALGVQAALKLVRIPVLSNLANIAVRHIEQTAAKDLANPAKKEAAVKELKKFAPWASDTLIDAAIEAAVQALKSSS